MKQSAAVSTLWVSIAISMLGCHTNRQGLGKGDAGRTGTGAGGATRWDGAIAAGGTGGAGGSGSGGAAATGGTRGATTATGGAGGGAGGAGGVGTGGSQVGLAGASGAGTGGSLATLGGAAGAAVGGSGGVAPGGAGGGEGGAAGGTASGGVRGSGGATGGTSAAVTSAGGGPGSGGTSGSGLQACTSSDGSGCAEPTFCVDTRSDTCSPDSTSGCTGFCAGRRHVVPCAGSGQSRLCPDGFACIPETRSYLGTDPHSVCVGPETKACTLDSDCPTGFLCVETPDGGRCSPDRVACDWLVSCRETVPGPCPAGYARSSPDACFGPCIPIESCACSADWHCRLAGAVCDRKEGRCYTPRSPEPRCLLPFDVGPCDAAVAVFAFIDGECRPETYGGCEGNDNRFSRIEECLSRCQGMPGELPCPDGRGETVVCLACGGGGGCIQYFGACARQCTAQADCQGTSFACDKGYCNAVACL